MPNRLAAEKSPYLLQHAHNPVDWFPWGQEALDKAQQEDKPILVSIGYSACHWCHVMERESFESEPTARLMNDNFVNIKVDREERPDVDQIYMEAVQALTGQGGWPLNVFLTPDGRPFYGGTYFPPERRHGMPSWPEIVQAVARAYREERADVMKNAAELSDYIRRSQQLAPSDEQLSPDVLRTAYDQAVSQFDWQDGGFGGAPKFPQPLGLDLVLRLGRRFDDEQGWDFLALTLRKMADGGIFDQLGGGFHRYSVDRVWLVPHFEKMLYDNALLARTYLHAFQVSGDPWYRSVVERTLDYLLRDLRSREGGFYSAEDADSEGVEGKYYVWTAQEMEEVLGPEAARIAGMRFGVTPEGNFEGKTILTVARSISTIAEETGCSAEEVERILADGQGKLLAARSQRVPPGKDTKIIASWNALVIRALAETGRVLDRSDYLDAAERAARFILTDLRPGGSLVRSYKDGPSRIPAFLEDYSFLLEALITLFETTSDVAHLDEARRLTAEMVKQFWDDSQGAFFDSPDSLAEPVARPRGFFDNPIPSGNSAAASALLRLAALTGDSAYSSWAEKTVRAAGELLIRAPLALPAMVSALDFSLSPQTQVAIAGDPRADDTRRLARAVFERFLPNAVVAIGQPSAMPLLEGRDLLDGKPTAYVCQHFACRLPVTDVGALQEQLEAIRA